MVILNFIFTPQKQVKGKDIRENICRTNKKYPLLMILNDKVLKNNVKRQIPVYLIHP